MANGAQRAGPQAAIIAHPVPTKRRKPLQKTAGARLAGAKAAAIAFGEVRGNPTPMAVSDQDLIECWFGTLTVPEIVKKLDLKSNSELRLQWRRLKDLGKLPPRSREGVDGESGQDGRPATGKCDLLLERLIKVHGETRNDLLKKRK